MDTDDLSELEEKALDIIRSNGSVLQKNLWKELECSAGKGSEIARELQSRDLVERTRTTSNGTSTYKIEPIKKDKKDLNYELLLAGDLIPPFVDNNIEHTDDRFTQWIINLQEDYDVDDI